MSNGKKAAVCEPERESWSNTESTSTSILDCSASREVKNKCCVSHPIFGIFLEQPELTNTLPKNDISQTKHLTLLPKNACFSTFYILYFNKWYHFLSSCQKGRRGRHLCLFHLLLSICASNHSGAAWLPRSLLFDPPITSHFLQITISFHLNRWRSLLNSSASL